jgi:hypothetical protein
MKKCSFQNCENEATHVRKDGQHFVCRPHLLEIDYFFKSRWGDPDRKINSILDMVHISMMLMKKN